MREKRGESKTLDPIGKDGSSFFACYILTSLSPRHKGHTYIGFTVNPRRRIRQHNGEITSGAWRTKKKRPWEMVLCIYGFPSNVSALQFEWAWQHPRESLAVREAATAFKSFSGLASKIKLAYTMLNLPSWNSLNLTVNYFSSKYAHHGGLSPSLPSQMKVQVCCMDDLPCFNKLDNDSHPEDEESPEVNEENEDDISSNRSQRGSSSTSSSNDLYTGEKEHFEDSLDENVEEEVSIEAMDKEPEAVLDDRLANFSGFGKLDDESIEEDEGPHSSNVGSFEAVEKDCWRRSNVNTKATEIEVVDLLTPSPSCRVGSSMKRRRVSEFIDLTKSPNFIEL